MKFDKLETNGILFFQNFDQNLTEDMFVSIGNTAMP